MNLRKQVGFHQKSSFPTWVKPKIDRFESGVLDGASQFVDDHPGFGRISHDPAVVTLKSPSAVTYQWYGTTPQPWTSMDPYRCLKRHAPRMVTGPGVPLNASGMELLGLRGG